MPQSTPKKRAVSTHVPGGLDHSEHTINNVVELTPSQSKPPVPRIENLARYKDDIIKLAMRPGRASQTLAARPSKQRSSVQDIFAKPPPRSRDKPGGNSCGGTGKVSSVVSTETTDSCLNLSKPTKVSSQNLSKSTAPKLTPSKPSTSSAALRETIAKAKAARHRIGKSEKTDTLLSQLVTDDFPETGLEGSNKGLLSKRVASARADGRLNIAAMGLKDMPSEVLNMYSANTDAGDGGAWYESVDLVRLVAADNEFEYLGEDIFPDLAAEAGSAMD